MARATEEVHHDEMDSYLNQPETQQSAIGKTLTVSYRINSIYDAVKTLVIILSWMTNLVAWNPGMVPYQANQLIIVFFLEHVICKLVSTAGRDWIAKFK